MDHPFEVGRTFRNRQGEYVVVSLQGPVMLIRYTDGTLLETRVEVQNRIWNNIQLDAAAERQQARLEAVRRERQARKGRGTAHRGRRAQGLVESDFKAGVAGTSWRARTHLGGLLAQELSLATPYEFQSYAIYRQAWVQIAELEHYDAEVKVRQAKFVFGLDAERATCGFYVERNDGPMDDTWHWPSMMRALKADEALHAELQTAMLEHNLQWRIHTHAAEPVGVVDAIPGALRWKWPRVDSPESLTWTGFVDRLGALDPETWWNLWLVTGLPKLDALAAGLDIARWAVAAYRALMRLYALSTGLEPVRAGS